MGHINHIHCSNNDFKMNAMCILLLKAHLKYKAIEPYVNHYYAHTIKLTGYRNN